MTGETSQITQIKEDTGPNTCCREHKYVPQVHGANPGSTESATVGDTGGLQGLVMLWLSPGASKLHVTCQASPGDSKWDLNHGSATPGQTSVAKNCLNGSA